MNTPIQQQANIPATVNIPTSQDRIFSMWWLNLREQLEALEHNVKGDMIDWEDGVWMPLDTPHLNKKGISVIMGQTQSCATKISPMTQYNEQEIYDKIFGLYETLLNNLFDNGNDYELDYTQLEHIIDMVTNFVQDVYNSAKDGNIVKFFQTIRREDEHTVIQKQPQNEIQQKKSWL